MRLATARQMKQLDQAAIRERGIASLELMERAAEALVREVLELAPERETPVGGESNFFTCPRPRGKSSARTERRRSSDGAAQETVRPGRYASAGRAITAGTAWRRQGFFWRRAGRCAPSWWGGGRS